MSAVPVIAPSLIEEARNRRPLSVVIGSYIQLRKVGVEHEGICPFHDDHSPSLNVNDRKSVWVCRACGVGGDAISFLRQHKGLTFAEAVTELAGADPESGPARFVRTFKESADEFAAAAGRRWENSDEERTNMAKASKLWSQAKAVHGTVAETYLRQARAISRPLPPSLRFIPWLPYWVQDANDKPMVAGRHPALLAAIQAPNNDIIAVQRIYLKDDGMGKADHPKPKKVVGPMQNGAVRLGARGPVMGIAEGVETALSASQIYSLPVWAACGAKRMRDMWIPPNCRELVIFRDNGKTGLEEAGKAAEVFEDQGRRVYIEPPAEPHGDWNDVLVARRAG